MAVSRQRMRLSGGTELSFLTAGAPTSPAVLLLHGFPNSARMFSDVMPELSKVAYAIAPDLPGFGESGLLPESSFAASGEAVEELLAHLDVGRRFVYLHDFGAPVGFHIAMRAPENVLGLIIQNANAHHTGFGPAWAATQAFWTHPDARNQAEATAHLTLEGTRDQYVSGLPAEIAARIPPARWEEDWRVMNLPGRMQMQRALIKDYGNYAARFDGIARYLDQRQPPALLLWGRHDVFFDLAELQSWMRDLPRMEAHILDAGHLLLETHSGVVAPLITEFVRRTIRCGGNRPTACPPTGS